MIGASAGTTHNFYEDDRIRVLVPAGWTAQPVTEKTSGDQELQIPVGAVLSKGTYRLYLLTHYGQASGIVGGRFGEISRYVAPWMSMTEPSGCWGALRKSESPVNASLSRVDLFFKSVPAAVQGSDDCKELRPSVRGAVWFGSFFRPHAPGDRGYFFLTFPLGRSDVSADEEMAFTATFDTKDPALLPTQHDAELNEFLRRASEIVNTIEYKPTANMPARYKR